MGDWFVAQALAEHGILSSMASGIARARYQFEAAFGPNASIYVLVGAAVLFVLLFGRRR